MSSLRYGFGSSFLQRGGRQPTGNVKGRGGRTRWMVVAARRRPGEGCLRRFGSRRREQARGTGAAGVKMVLCLWYGRERTGRRRPCGSYLFVIRKGKGREGKERRGMAGKRTSLPPKTCLFWALPTHSRSDLGLVSKRQVKAPLP